MLISGNLKLNSLDYVLIVDRDYNIIFNTRYESKVNSTAKDFSKDEYLKKNLFEAYPSLDRATSSVVECITTGEVVIRKFQKIVDFTGKVTWSNNITVPLIRKGMIMGAVELAKDVATVDTLESENNEDDRLFNELAESIKKDVGVVTFDKILTSNTTMLKNIEKAKILAKLPNPTLIYGETGTGKELFVQAMINYSGIPRSKVVIQNCASVPENLIESILFGTVRGAYTGAETTKGLFEQADGGILFLDELSAMPYHVQSKLLRVIQDGSFRPLGSHIEKRVNVKIFAAMNVDPVIAMEDKILRDDLFYRFSSSMINLLPLRERLEDVEYYVAYFIEEFNKVYGKTIRGIDEALKDFFLRYRWDGNVRELKHVIESMVYVAKDDVLSVRDLPAYVYGRMQENSEHPAPKERIFNPMTSSSPAIEEDFNLRAALEKKERELILQALEYCGGNKTKAGMLLGIPRQTLKYKIDKLKIASETCTDGNDKILRWEFCDADRKLSQ
jgi:arginine utilization regulatory protein